MLEDLDSADEITKHVARLLRLADVGEWLPTPVEDIVVAAGLTKTDEIHITESMIRRAPAKMQRLLRSAARKIQGVLHRGEQVIQIAPTNSAERERFVTCHEVTHAILPWQSDLAVLGDNQRALCPSRRRPGPGSQHDGVIENAARYGLSPPAEITSTSLWSRSSNSSMSPAGSLRDRTTHSSTLKA